MSYKIFRLILALTLLLGGLIWVKHRYFEPDFSIKIHFKDSSIQAPYQFIADTSLYPFSSYEGKMAASSNFFSEKFISYFPSVLGDWVGKDIEHQYADIKLFRLYHHQKTNDDLWLMMVYGAHESQFHSAEVCYMSDGWDVAVRDIKKVMTDQGTFPIRYMIAQKGNNMHLVAYWYLWGNPRRRIQEGTLLFRISIELRDQEERGQKALIDFMTRLMNVVMEEEKPIVPALVQTIPQKTTLPPVQVTSSFSRAKEKALNWILNQKVPNTIVPFPEMDRRYFLLSYELNSKNPKTQNDKSYPYIYSRAAIYDNALGVIAFTQAHRYTQAENVMDAFERVVGEDGSLWFSYNTHNEWPSESDHSEATLRTGASSWGGYAITYYLRQKLLEDPSFTHTKSFKRYESLARKILDRLLQEQIVDEKDPRFGFITGGQGRHELVFDEKSRKVIEKFKDEKITWASIEHNLDAYFLLKNMEILTHDPRYKKAKDLLKEALLSKAWNEKEGQFNRGVRKEEIDSAMALDCASWGILFLLSIGEKEKARQAMNAMERYFIQDPIRGVWGYRPYYAGFIYDEMSINKLFYPHWPQKSWSDIPMVWSEGSLGVAMAYLKMGEKEKAKSILEEISKMQMPSGGFQYATQEIPFQFSPSPSMAGTAWFAMVALALENETLLKLFWD